MWGLGVEVDKIEGCGKDCMVYGGEEYEKVEGWGVWKGVG